MKRMHPSALGRALASLALFAALGVVPVGCGGNDKAGETGNAEVPPAIQKANNAMENFAKKDKK